MHAHTRSNGLPLPAALLRVFVFALVFVLAGCRNRSDLVEAELRTREREVIQLRNDLQRSETLSSALENELRQRPGAGLPFPPGGEIIDRPMALMANTVQRIELGRGSGGIDEDKYPGDEALQLIVVPRDGEGSAIKAPGHLVVKVFEVSSEGLKVPLGKWEVASVDLQKTWKSGVFSTGYVVTLPWRNWPSSEKLRVVVQFATLPDQRWFEADKDVTIKLMPGGPRPGPAPLPSGAIPVGPPAIGEPPPPPQDGLRFPTSAHRSEDAPAARIGVARAAPSLEERLRQRQEAAKPAPSSLESPTRIEAPPDISPRPIENMKPIEAPPMAEPVAPPSPPVRLLPPDAPDR